MEYEEKTLLKLIEEKHLKGAAWKSDQASLVRIFSWANDHEVHTGDPSVFSVSKFRVIIKEAKQAIQNNDPQRLSELFHMAETLTLVELRLGLGLSEPEEISVVPVGEGEETQLQVLLRNDQLQRIQASTKPYFRFIQ